MNTIDYSKLQDIEVDGIDTSDAPDFADAYVSFATLDGVPLTDSELDSLDSGFVYDQVMNHIN
jgi:hypothetical protein